ncbi:MAG: leucine-rich repeat domain-containing protein [Bacteroidales bacterium]|nr:leucine-rich repeat domain-containing protein [Bacteroidales bacterium]
MKKILLFAGFMLTMAMSWCQVYDFSLVSDTGSGNTNIGGFRAELFFKINADSSTVVLVDVEPLSTAQNHFVGNTLELPQSVVVGDGETGLNYVVNKIGPRAFTETRFRSIYLPATINEIQDSAFYDAVFDSLTMYGGVERIGAKAFVSNGDTNVSYLTYFNFLGTMQQWLDMEIDGDNATPVSWSRVMHNYDTVVTDVVIPEGMRTIPPYHFTWNQGLRTVSLPSTLDSIGEATFKFCINLDSVNIPHSIRYIGDRAFDNCLNLRVVDYKAVRCRYAGSAGRTIFAGCNNISKIIIDPYVEQLPDFTFMYCRGINQIVLPEGLHSIGANTFAQCSGLRGKLTLPEHLISVGGYAFHGCTGLDTLQFDCRSCTFADGYSQPPFTLDTNIRVLIVGANVEVLPNSCFSGLRGVSRIISRASVPPYVPNSIVFDDIDRGAYVTVPCGCEQAYQTEYGWDRFYTIRSLESDMYSYAVVSADETMGTVQIMTEPECVYLYMQIKAIPNEGYRFLRWNDGNENPHRWVYVDRDTVMTAYFEVQNEGIGLTEEESAKVYAQNGCIVVEIEGEEQVQICDMMGRVLVDEMQSGCGRYGVATNGMYLVKIGRHSTRKVFVW